MAPLLRFVRRPIFMLALTQLGVCITAAVCFFTLNKIPEWLFLHLRTQAHSPESVYLYNVFLIGAVVLGPTLLQGASFPLVIRIVSDHARTLREAKASSALEAGKLVGRAYAINTLGAIIGSFAAGFILMPLLGLRVAMGLTLGLNLAVGIGLSVLSLQRQWLAGKLIPLTAGILAVITLFIAAPELNLTRLSSGAFRVYWARELFTTKTFQRDKPEMLFYRDGVAATISVERRGRLLTLKANGKPEASNDADMATQILVGLLPLVMHESTATAQRQIKEGTYEGAKDVAMVGFGSGVTAGASLTYPLERLDVVEIEAAMLDASRAFDEVNHSPLDDPRIRVIESDGRNFLEYTQQSYDVIVSEPSNPWIAGVASLFTVEHFARARDKLKPGGVFCQWVQLYELRPENVGRIFKTFRHVFPHVYAFSSMEKGTDLVLVGSNEPLHFTAQGYPLAFGDASVRRELRRAGVSSAYDLYALTFLEEEELAGFLDELEAALGYEIILNTDDNGILEFKAPRDLVDYKAADQFFATIYYGDRIYGDLRPLFQRWDNPQEWTPDRIAKLSYSSFIKGKQELAEILATEALRRGPTKLGRAVEAASRLYQQGPESLLLANWPFSNTPIYNIVHSGIDQQAPLPALEYLYSTQKQRKDVFEDPEAMLAAAYFLFKTRHYKRAHGQLLILLNHSDFAWRAPVVHLMLGFTFTKRRRYRDAFMHFMRFWEIAFEGQETKAPLEVHLHNEKP